MKLISAGVVVALAFLADGFAEESLGASFFGRKTSTSTASSSPFSSPLLVDESISYPTPALAIQALNQAAEEKYRKLTGDRTSNLAALGAKAQQLAELAGYIVERRDQDGNPVFHVTGLQKLPAEGGMSRGVRVREGDRVYGYHTGYHTDPGTGVSILSNTDFKGLLASGNEAEFAYDMEARTLVGMDREGNLFQLADSGDWVDLSGEKADFCQRKHPDGQSRYDETVSFLQSGGARNDGPACVPETPGAIPGNASTPAIPADLSAMAGQLAGQIGGIQSQLHECTSFAFVKDYRGANREVYAKRYRCRECGRETMVNVRDGETIEDKIAANRQRQTFANQAYSTAQSALQGISAGPGTATGTVP